MWWLGLYTPPGSWEVGWRDGRVGGAVNISDPRPVDNHRGTWRLSCVTRWTWELLPSGHWVGVGQWLLLPDLLRKPIAGCLPFPSPRKWIPSNFFPNLSFLAHICTAFPPFPSLPHWSCPWAVSLFLLAFHFLPNAVSLRGVLSVAVSASSFFLSGPVSLEAGTLLSPKCSSLWPSKVAPLDRAGRGKDLYTNLVNYEYKSNIRTNKK